MLDLLLFLIIVVAVAAEQASVRFNVVVDFYFAEATWNIIRNSTGVGVYNNYQTFTYSNQQNSHVLSLEIGEEYYFHRIDEFGDGGISASAYVNEVFIFALDAYDYSYESITSFIVPEAISGPSTSAVAPTTEPSVSATFTDVVSTPAPEPGSYLVLITMQHDCPNTCSWMLYYHTDSTYYVQAETDFTNDLEVTKHFWLQDQTYSLWLSDESFAGRIAATIEQPGTFRTTVDMYWFDDIYNIEFDVLPGDAEVEPDVSSFDPGASPVATAVPIVFAFEYSSDEWGERGVELYKSNTYLGTYYEEVMDGSTSTGFLMPGDDYHLYLVGNVDYAVSVLRTNGEQLDYVYFDDYGNQIGGRFSIRETPIIYVRLNLEGSAIETTSWNIRSDYTGELVFPEPQQLPTDTYEHGVWVTLETGQYTLYRYDTQGIGMLHVRLYDSRGDKFANFRALPYSETEIYFTVSYPTSDSEEDNAAVVASVSAVAVVVVVALAGAFYVKRRRAKKDDNMAYSIPSKPTKPATSTITAASPPPPPPPPSTMSLGGTGPESGVGEPGSSAVPSAPASLSFMHTVTPAFPGTSAPPTAEIELLEPSSCAAPVPAPAVSLPTTLSPASFGSAMPTSQPPSFPSFPSSSSSVSFADPSAPPMPASFAPPPYGSSGPINLEVMNVVVPGTSLRITRPVFETKEVPGMKDVV